MTSRGCRRSSPTPNNNSSAPSADQDAEREGRVAAERAGGPRGAAQELVDMVDPPEEGEAGERPLLERLRGAPQKVVKFL
jgi:hypothetical protein